MRTVLTLLAVSALAVGAAACGDDDDDAATGDAATIVVTTAVLGDIVGAALDGVDGITVDTVMPVGADPHEFQPSARQAERLTAADLLVVNGLDLESGLVELIDRAADDGVPVVAMSDHVDVRELGDADHDDAHDDDAHDDEAHDDEAHDDEAHDDHGHDHGSSDPHLWMDPTQVASAVDALRADVAAATGADPAAVDTAVDAYLDELAELDREITEVLADIPADRRKLVTNHESLGYFAERYDFELIGSVVGSLTTGAEPSASDLDALADEMRRNDVRAVFVETTDSDRLADALAAEVGDDVAVVELFTGSPAAEGDDGDTYLEMMRINAQRIAEALG